MAFISCDHVARINPFHHRVHLNKWELIWMIRIEHCLWCDAHVSFRLFGALIDLLLVIGFLGST